MGKPTSGAKRNWWRKQYFLIFTSCIVAFNYNIIVYGVHEHSNHNRYNPVMVCCQKPGTMAGRRRPCRGVSVGSTGNTQNML